MRSLISVVDAMGVATMAVNPSDTVQAVILAAGVSKQVSVPSEARLVLFNASRPFWARIGGATSLPVADILDGSAPELCPSGRALDGAASIGLVSAEPCQISLSYYR